MGSFTAKTVIIVVELKIVIRNIENNKLTIIFIADQNKKKNLFKFIRHISKI